MWTNKTKEYYEGYTDKDFIKQNNHQKILINKQNQSKTTKRK